MNRTHRTISRTAAAALAVGTLGLGACASGGGPQASARPAAMQPSAARRAAADNAAMVQVINNRATPMDVSVLGAGQSKYLGTVPVSDTVATRIPQYLLATTREIQLSAHPLGGGRTYISPPLYVDRGTIIQWTLDPSGQLVPMVLSGD